MILTLALDEGKPICARCTKSGYQCQGYERKLDIREHTFVQFGDEHRIQTSRPPPKTPKNTSVVLILDPASREPSPPSVPQSLSLIAFRDDMQFSLVIDNSVWRTYGWPWLELSAQGRLGGLALDACRCFAQTVFGKHHHQKQIELEGSTLYGHTLRNLSAELDNLAGTPDPERLITPILLLLMYASTGGDRNASQFHVMGLIKVLRYCRPANLAGSPFRLAFESSRSTLVST